MDAHFADGLDNFEHVEIAANEIRLLELLPHEPYSCLRFALRTFAREAAPPHLALSYEWGASSELLIILDDARFYVQHNLHDALTSIVRQKDSIWTESLVAETSVLGSSIRKLIWIDSICIDQDNVHELNTQVSLMQQTYAEATTVIVWLGKESEGPLTLPQLRRWRWRDNVKQLANRTYWSRLWVIQEFLMARHVLIMCGGSRILEQDFFEELDLAPQECAARSFGWLASRASAIADLATYSLDEMLTTYRECQCSQPKDRIFALLGCINEQERKALLPYFPNYNLDYNEIVVIALAHIIRVSSNTPSLYHVLFRHITSGFAGNVTSGLAENIASGLAERLLEIAQHFEILSRSPLDTYATDANRLRVSSRRRFTVVTQPGFRESVGEEVFVYQQQNLDYRCARDYLLEDDVLESAKVLYYFRSNRLALPWQTVRAVRKLPLDVSGIERGRTSSRNERKLVNPAPLYEI